MNRFRPKGNFRRRYFPAQKKKPSQELLWAITAGRSLGESVVPTVEPVYESTNKFEDFDILDQIKRNISSKHYTVPTPIQDKAIPEILAGRDIIGISNTGTGKTAAFIVPLLDKVMKGKYQKVLIVAPTRELAIQINDNLKEFASGLPIKSVLLIGGTGLWQQKQKLSLDCEFVVGTPGRIKDLIGQRSLDLSKFNNVVLDEADRMVDIGFIGDIKYFISLLPHNRQSLFFSATISKSVEDIISSFVTNPVTISTKTKDTRDNISQDVVKVERNQQKIDKLHDLLISEGFEKVLIFGRTKWSVQKLTNELQERGFNAGVIHGNKSQSQRQKTLEMFRNSKINVLLATDVASRGLDIEDVSHVINYDMPASYEDYIHRIGRTGRANKRGTALTFVD